MENNSLAHYGILGMKWGVRRYQNKDGTYTSAGKKRKQKEYIHEDYANAHSKKSVKSMSNAELKARNNRLQMEQQYANLTRQTSTGKKVVQEFIKTAGLLSGVMGAYGTYKKVGNQIIQSDVGKKMTDSVINTIGSIMLSDLFYKGH